jgi:hypothetical protein
MVLSIALVDAMIKDADIVAVGRRRAGDAHTSPLTLTSCVLSQVFRAIHHLLLEAIHNPFLSLPPSFRARPAHQTPENQEPPRSDTPGHIVNPPVKGTGLFATGPEEIQPEWLSGSKRFQRGVEKIGQLLSGGRA